MNIVVVGDVLLDVDLDGMATRLCPDAPVPVVDVDTARRRAGGAGLVARMLAADGHRVRLVTVLSDDDGGAHLRAELNGVDVVAGPSGAPTPTKTRVRANGQSVVRFDEGCAPAAVPGATARMLEAVAAADVVIVSDYGRGLTSCPRLRTLLRERTAHVPVVWDPHPAGSEPVAGVTVVTPNLAEALKASGVVLPSHQPGPDHSGAAAAAGELLALWGSRAVAVTLGGDGALLLTDPDKPPRVLPARQVTVTDVCGAGDRFAASVGVHLGRGSTLEDAVAGAVSDASAYLAAGGVAALPPAALSGEYSQPAALSGRPSQPEHFADPPTDPVAVVRRTRERGGVVVATGGCFDLLHAGHARTLAAARNMGDCLVVCLNSDDSVRRLKGEQRPIISQQDRAELLLALGCVDAVLVFEEDTPEAALERLRPDIWVKGGDYRPADLPETALLRSWGGRTVTVPYHPARSTTGLAEALTRVG